MRKLNIKILTIIISILTCILIIDNIFINTINAIDTNNKTEKIPSTLKTTTLGIGGGGLLLNPSISPFDENTMIVIPDIGGIYVSHNTGIDWKRKNLQGLVQKAYFDPNRENIVYAGGTGLYRSTDNGDAFNLIFPKEEEIIERRNCDEVSMQYLFTNTNYPTYKQVKDILVNPNDSNNIFVLMYYGKEGIVFESKNNGESFEEIFSYTKKNSNSNLWKDYNMLLYQKETDTLYYSIEEGIFRFDRNEGKCNQVYNSELGIVNMAYFQENGKTYFIVIENTNQLEKFDTKVFYTTDFTPENTIDISSKIINGLQDTFNAGEYTDITYNWKFEYIAASSLNNIYITQKSFSNNSAYPYDIAGIIRFNGESSKWLYGNPYKNHATSTLVEKGWIDGNIAAYGIALSKKAENAILYTTLCGVYYSPDSEDFYQRYCRTINEGNATKYVTNGIDEQTTYGVRINPFNKENILLLNTDLGLIRSEDNGASWSRAITGIKPEWINTIYDAEFDTRKENVVYSVWSGRHDMPYEPGNETDGATKRGGFAISNDAGKTWNCEYSKGLPETAIPVKMSVVYPQNNKDNLIEDDLTIYVATMNHGFFVSYDTGKTFTQINEGIKRVSYKEGEQYQYILAEDIEAKDGRVFGCTAKSTYNGQVQPGEVFELKNNRWEKIELPSDVQIPRYIYYNNGTLYISATVVRTWEPKNGVDYGSVGGGLYAYKDGEVNQIFDKNISVTGVQIDSKGVMYVSDINGNIYRKTANSDYVKIYNIYHSISKGIQLENDDELYLSTLGGGLLKLEGLESLREEDKTDDKNNSGKPNNPSEDNNTGATGNPNGDNNTEDTNNPSGDSNIGDANNPSGDNNTGEESNSSGDNNAEDIKRPSGDNNIGDTNNSNVENNIGNSNNSSGNNNAGGIVKPSDNNNTGVTNNISNENNIEEVNNTVQEKEGEAEENMIKDGTLPQTGRYSIVIYIIIGLLICVIISLIKIKHIS